MARLFPLLLAATLAGLTLPLPGAAAISCVHEVFGGDPDSIVRCVWPRIEWGPPPPPPVNSTPQEYEEWAVRWALSKVCVKGTSPPEVYVAPDCGPKDAEERDDYFLVLGPHDLGTFAYDWACFSTETTQFVQATDCGPAYGLGRAPDPIGVGDSLP